MKILRRHRYYVVSSRDDLNTLNPAVPNNFLSHGGYIDTKKPRIQVFKSVSDALSATFLGQKLRPGSSVYVYEIQDLKPESLIGPLGILDVPYYNLVHEYWYLRSCSVRLVAPISIDSLEKEETYHYGPRQTKAPLYRWKWTELYPKPWERKLGPKLKQYSSQESDINSLTDRQLERLANKVVSHRKKVRQEKQKLHDAKKNTLASESKPALNPTTQDEATIRAQKNLGYKKALRTEEGVIRKELINTIRNDNT